MAVVGMRVPPGRGTRPTIHPQRLARDVRRQRRGQEHRSAGHLVDVSRPAHRHHRAQVIDRTGRHGQEPFGDGDVRRQGVHADAVRRQLDRGGPSQVDHAGLGSGVGGIARRGAGALDRGDVHDAPTESLGDQHPRDALGAQQDVGQVRPPATPPNPG